MAGTGIIGAMEVEVEQLKDIMRDVRIVEKAGMQFYCGRLGKEAAA